MTLEHIFSATVQAIKMLSQDGTLNNALTTLKIDFKRGQLIIIGIESIKLIPFLSKDIRLVLSMLPDGHKLDNITDSCQDLFCCIISNLI